MVIHKSCGCQGSGDASDGLRPPPSGVLDQEIEGARFADEFLNARRGADDPQHTMRGRGQVVHLNQLADAAGVQIRHGRQIQLYSSNPSAQDKVNTLHSAGIPQRNVTC